MMITAYATGNTTAGTSIVEIDSPSLSCYIYAIATADDVTIGVPLPGRFQPTPSHYAVRGHYFLEGIPKLGVVALGGNWDSALLSNKKNQY